LRLCGRKVLHGELMRQLDRGVEGFAVVVGENADSA
jgi:hypothetical protein